MKKALLPEFQEFLRSRKLVPDKSVPFFAFWASGFIVFSDKNAHLEQGLLAEKYIDSLKGNENIEDWQIRQAETALNIYRKYYLSSASESNITSKNHLFSDISRLRQLLKEAIRIRHYSLSTEQTYLDWTRKFYDYLTNIKKKDLNTSAVGSEDLRDYLSYLAIEMNVSASTQNQAFNAILFLMRYVLCINISNLGDTVRAKRGTRLPVVLSVSEIRELFKYVSRNNQLIIHLLYGSGMRIMEALRLRVNDIDFDSDMIHVRCGKGDKDRTTILPSAIKSRLIAQLKVVSSIHNKDLRAGKGDVYLPDALRHKYINAEKEFGWQYVFPASNLSVDPRSGKVRRHHVGEKSIQVAVRKAAKKAGILKHATVHTLRHSFATHLLQEGVNIREIQDLLGHKSVETTMVYTHVIRNMENAPKSPLDKLYGSKDKESNNTVPLEVVDAATVS